MSKKQERVGKLIALSECLSGPKSANKKNVTYERGQIDACLKVIEDILKLDNIFKA